MDDKDVESRTRVNKFEKRRKNTKAITGFVGLGTVLAVVLLMILIFGGGPENEGAESAANNDTNGNSEDVSKEDKPENTESSKSDQSNENGKNKTNFENEDKTNETDLDDLNSDEENPKEDVPSEDDNVIEAFTRNWDPIGTEQSEPHVVQYDEGTKDRNEMEKAIQLATGLDEMITWWLGNNGEQKVVATVSSIDQTENYRVYLSWIANEGWQPTKVEKLKENDEK